MAGKPGSQKLVIVCWLCLMGCSFSGCEVGRTMFEYNSGGSPWLGIDLIPQKKKMTKIDHRQSVPAAKKQNSLEPVELAEQSETPAEKFHKKPLRLNLPASRVALQPTGMVNGAAENAGIKPVVSLSHRPIF